MAKQNISAKAVAADIRSGMGNAELMDKYGLSATGIESVIEKLIEHGVISAAEISGIRQARPKPIEPESRKAPAECARNPSEPPVDPELAKAVVEDVRRGKHDYDIMIRLGLGPDELRALIENLVRLGQLSAEEVEARKPGKGKQCPYCSSQVFEGDVQCKKCGKDLTRAVSSPSLLHGKANAVRPGSGPLSDDQDYAWEDYRANRAGRRLLRAYFHTVSRCIVSPAKFFTNLPLDAGYWAPTLFGAISFAIPVTFYVVLLEFLTTSSGQRDFGWLPFLGVVTFLGGLVLSSIGLFIWSALVHGSLLALGGAHSRFQATFRVVCYSGVTSLFSLIPVIGAIVGGLWDLCLSGIGLRETHRTSTGRAFGAVLIAFCVAVAAWVMIALNYNLWDDWKYASSAKKPMIATAYTEQSLPSDDALSQPTGFKTDADDFSVITPSPLEEKKVAVNTVLGKIDMSVFSAKQGNVEYSIICSPDVTPSYVRYFRLLPSLPFFSSSRDLERMLDQYGEEMARKLNGKVLSETKMMLDDKPGKEIVIELPEKFGQEAVLKVRAFWAKDRVYQAMVVAPREELNTREVKLFLESFSLVNQ
ncbi:MAG: YIP1 family protein [Thermodesulfobacteriota bacterium]